MTQFLKKNFSFFLIALFVLILLIAFREWFLHFDILTLGDWGYYFNETEISLRIYYFSAWLSDFSFGRVLIDSGQAPTYFLYGVLAKYLNLSYAFSERFVHFWPAVCVALLGSWLFIIKFF